MLNHFTADAKHIFLAVGNTDFRKQISSLVAMTQLQFNMDPFNTTSIFIFCNKKRDAIKILRYDKNGFILVHKKLLEKMKFQWPKDVVMTKEISHKQVEWLLQGLDIEQKKAHHDVIFSRKQVCF
jgi:transposase